MYRRRLIPVLLLQGSALVKSLRFKKHAYVGDPVNATRIFSYFNADELIVLDILASREDRILGKAMLADIAAEARMPLSVGGGIRSLSHIQELISAGVEKVVIGTHAVERPSFVREAALEFGSSAVSVCIDAKRSLLGKEQVRCLNGTRRSRTTPAQFAQQMEEQGAGEIIIQSIDRDGCMIGYDIGLVRAVAESVAVPVVALGGAGNVGDFREVLQEGKASAAAAGSAFVYLKRRGAVLINYPPPEDRVL